MRWPPAPERFRAKVSLGPIPDARPDLGACWLWTGWCNSHGYGGFTDGGRQVGAHVWAWEQEHGPVADGLELDHLCRVRSCARPSHMEAVTHRLNMLRGETVAAEAAARDVCVNGHAFTSENTYLRPSGKRDCRACNAARQRARR